MSAVVKQTRYTLSPREVYDKVLADADNRF